MTLGEQTHIPYVRLNFNKQPRKSVFETARVVRTILGEEVAKLGPDWQIEYGFDLADIISQDYRDLGSNSLQTLLLVFACVFFFIGIRSMKFKRLSVV